MLISRVKATRDSRFCLELHVPEFGTGDYLLQNNIKSSQNPKITKDRTRIPKCFNLNAKIN